MRYTVALTGGIGSGKTTIANAFADRGIDVVDADVIARQIVRPGRSALSEIAAKFGSVVLQQDGTLNRALLRQRIFTCPTDKDWLNALLHPLIHAETRRQLALAKSEWCLWVVPLLVENNLHPLASRVLVVDVDRDTQLARTIARDRISREQAECILATQVTREQRLAVADDIIDNSGLSEDIAAQVSLLDQHYRQLSRATNQD
ncbi:dephospho-CoA kinase [Erwinia tracheiphila]|uniref:Dephospho-CoA kinase n=1 Tax=Erwinia tracheiphila TaxID=65700 RepID=A0A0M2KGQ0_9GAMM|nr:dephospho-CoA kinase [Erwinia tracheiphila]AXF77237.1 dephospho-CoA kinase [Erwinia tracheiphila]EOS94962.1 dephospho-CoA kinase [Erwinia tracheiphila PSU-1]KKF36111.1 dephospho-CoA kinase [Erwinia tracheiphila]UIA84071.1 dephospho-CoA kinase [Erwinia tracheiphila]UIA87428.1 dephospho-CoA kinase [Erwinia tracheiphila]